LGRGASIFVVVIMPSVSDPKLRAELLGLYTKLPKAMNDAVLPRAAPIDEHEYARWKAAMSRLAEIKDRIKEITGE
jgi:hypothetical protein